MDSTQWFVAVDGNTVGPVSTALLKRGLEQGKVPVDALVCAAGDQTWQAVRGVPPFSYELFGQPRPPTGRGSGGARPTDPFASARAVAPIIAQDAWRASVAHDRDSQLDVATGPLPHPPASQEEALELDVVFDSFDDETKPRFFNWLKPLAPYFQPLDSLDFPSELLLVGSLPTTSWNVLLQEEAMWNLALCLSFGSESLASAVASRFCTAIIEAGDPSKIEWMTRALLSRGFMPSGIPRDLGQDGFAMLLRRCPPELEDYLV